jgi:hypothetical protein
MESKMKHVRTLVALVLIAGALAACQGTTIAPSGKNSNGGGVDWFSEQYRGNGN